MLGTWVDSTQCREERGTRDYGRFGAMAFRENDSDFLYKGLLSCSDDDSSDPPSAL